MPSSFKSINPAYIFFHNQLKGHACRKRQNTPDIPNAKEMPVLHWKDSDWRPAPICGWYAEAEKARGTMIVAHGYMANCLQNVVLQIAHICLNLGWNVVCPDLRMHGRSHDACPTFGMAESWDLEAVLSWVCHRSGLNSPVAISGYSLGGLAASNLLARDPRLSGGFFLSTPGWPWHAIKTETKKRPLPMFTNSLAESINMWYGRDILDEGDLRRMREKPHHPRTVVYAMGTRDHYGIDNTIEVFNSPVWGGGKVVVERKGGDVEGNGEHGSIDELGNGTNVFIRCKKAHHIDFERDWISYPKVVASLVQLLGLLTS